MRFRLKTISSNPILLVLVMFLLCSSYIKSQLLVPGGTGIKKSITADTLFGNPPGENPVMFGKGIVSKYDRSEYGLSVSKDFSELFFTASGENLMIMKKNSDGSWTTPKIANLRQNNSEEFEAFYSNDNSKVFFSYMVGEYDSRITYVLKNADGFSAPVSLESPINNYSVFWSTLSKNNTLYFTNFTLSKAYRSKFVNGQYKDIEEIGLPGGVFHPFISANEDFVLFDLNGDINISFIKSNGKFGTPVKFDSRINSSYWESCASLTPDEKYMFFSRYNDLNDKADIYWVKIDDIIANLKKLTAVKDEIVKPETPELLQNYPNPFNPSTNINYFIPKRDIVTLKLYNLLGEEVKNIFEGEIGEGFHTISFNASDLASGTYIYRLKTSQISISKKMQLIK